MPDPLNNSYYAATANPWVRQPSLTEALSCDVCVIGGGFTGLSAALCAAEGGYSVVLLEAETIGFGASGRSGGQLIPGLRWTMREIDAQFGRARATAIFDLGWSAVGRVRDRIEKHGISCDLKVGHFEAAYKVSHFDDMRREADFISKVFAHDVDVVEPDDVGQHISGGDYHGGVYNRGGGHFHPLNYALGLADAALAEGVRIFEHSRVKAFEPRIATSAGCIDATYTVIATDSWTSDISPGLGQFTVPIMNYNIATAPLGNVADALLPSDAAIADSRFVLNYFRLSADRRLIFGGGEKYTQTPPTDIAAFVRPFMARVFPSLADVDIDYAWGGLVGCTANRLPHIGRSGNMFFAHGFSGHGAAITTLTGELIVETMRGKAERFDVLATLPHRPFPGGRLFAKPLATLGLLWYALRDRL